MPWSRLLDLVLFFASLWYHPCRISVAAASMNQHQVSQVNKKKRENVLRFNTLLGKSCTLKLLNILKLSSTFQCQNLPIWTISFTCWVLTTKQGVITDSCYVLVLPHQIHAASWETDVYFFALHFSVQSWDSFGDRPAGAPNAIEDSRLYWVLLPNPGLWYSFSSRE